MSAATLVLPAWIADAIGEAAKHPLETAAVILANIHRSNTGSFRVLAREIHWVPEAHYLDRQSDRLAIIPEGYVPSLARAAELGSIAIWFHTHPGEDGIPLPSKADRKVDSLITDLFRIRADTPWYGTLIASPREGSFTFTGQIQSEQGDEAKVEKIWRIGDRWQMLTAYGVSEDTPAKMFDRNIKAFGPGIQSVIGALKVAVVGCGGTGSAVSEQLIRLGINFIGLFDVDDLSLSNVTRVYGSTPADVGRPKVNVLQEHLLRINPELSCQIDNSMITREATARKLGDFDVVFGCTDDNAGRLVLSRLATYMLVPVIDMGVLLSSSTEGALTGIDGRVTILSPGTACLVCRNRVDLARAGAELMTPDERNRLADEGYAPALAGTEPAVVAFTTAVAAAAVQEFLERLIGFGPDPRPSEVLLRWHDREISGNVAAPRPGHYCDTSAGKIGSGPARPFLEQTWPGA